MGHEADVGHIRVGERLQALLVADAGLARALQAASVAIANIPAGALQTDALEAVDSLIAALRSPLPPELDKHVPRAGAAGRTAEVAGDADAAPAAEPIRSAAIQDAYAQLGVVAGAAAALFPTGRLMFVGEACDFAETRLTGYARAMKALNALLPQVIAFELREEGLPCRCICAMCSIGACGCIWVSLHLIDVAWGGPGLPGPDEHGLPLRSPPRPGSQLADADVRQWDRVILADGEPVRSQMTSSPRSEGTLLVTWCACRSNEAVRGARSPSATSVISREPAGRRRRSGSSSSFGSSDAAAEHMR
jgi:hypothetical protein